MNLHNLSDNIDFYLELSPSKANRNSGTSRFNEDGSPFDYSETLQKKLFQNPLNPFIWRFKTFCMDYEYYLQ